MQSLVTPFGYSTESCGYCKDAATGRRTAESRASYYFSSKGLTVDVYQALVDRGWRRSGTVFYKPDVLRHCCPHYTIRLPVADFKPSRDCRQAINKWNRYVLGDVYMKEAARLYPKSKGEKTAERNTFNLTKTVRESQYENLKCPPDPAHKFEVTLEPDEFTKEKYELFHNYQQHVHKEKPSEISQGSFKRFLCGSPLHRTTSDVNGKTQVLGSYHQCYRLNGRLIAMGVLDLLPHCVSGVYFIYHQDFEKWSFGKLSALTEASLALEGGYEYYYMGFYIHTCAKMRYKGEYRPSYILDPESYEWSPLDGEVRQLLDQKRYVSLARERRRASSKTTTKEGIGEVVSEDDPATDDYSDYPMANAAESGQAVMKGMSLFELRVPGVMTAEEVEEKVSLGEQAIKITDHPLVEARDLVSWDDGDIQDRRSLKGLIAELVACIGPEVAPDVIVDFS